MTSARDDEFAYLFESAFQEEESMSISSSLNQVSLASSSIHLLSLGPRLSAGRNAPRRSSTDLSGEYPLEAAGLPDGAWQRLYRRIETQSGPATCAGASQALTKNDGDEPRKLMRTTIQAEERGGDLGGSSRASSMEQLYGEAGRDACNNSAAEGKSRPSASSLGA